MARNLTINHRKWTRGKDVVRESSPLKEWECDGNLIRTRKRPNNDSGRFSDVMSIDSRATSREGTPMSVCIDLETDGYMNWEPGHAPTIASRKLEPERLNHSFMDWELAPVCGGGVVDAHLSA
jgi:hypothetical protein